MFTTLTNSKQMHTPNLIGFLYLLEVLKLASPYMTLKDKYYFITRYDTRKPIGG